MKKIIKLTESDLTKLIERIVKESMEDTHIPFGDEELEDIKSGAIRYMQPGFFEDYEVCGYILKRANGDKELAHKLVRWLENEGLDLQRHRCLFHF